MTDNFIDPINFCSPPPSDAYEEVLRDIASRPGGWQAIDTAHALLLAGLVASHKPARVLELGIGSGYGSRVLLSALMGNGAGTLVSVDNFFDWNGIKPSHMQELQKIWPGWEIVVQDETAFVQTAADHEYDFILSDGDHTQGYQNAPDVFRLCRPGGIMVFHDTRSELFTLLSRLPRRVRALGFSTLHFFQQSRNDERTDRGLLVVCKDRQRRFTLDWATRLFFRLRLFLPQSLVARLRRKAAASAGGGMAS